MRVTYWLVVGSVMLMRGFVRLLVYLGGSWILATRDSLPCMGCGGAVSLHGWYRCDVCGATYLGSAFAPCPTPGCGRTPPFIPCPRCTHSVWNPTLSGVARRPGGRRPRRAEAP